MYDIQYQYKNNLLRKWMLNIDWTKWQYKTTSQISPWNRQFFKRHVWPLSNKVWAMSHEACTNMWFFRLWLYSVQENYNAMDSMVVCFVFIFSLVLFPFVWLVRFSIVIFFFLYAICLIIDSSCVDLFLSLETGNVPSMRGRCVNCCSNQLHFQNGQSNQMWRTTVTTMTLLSINSICL